MDNALHIMGNYTELPCDGVFGDLNETAGNWRVQTNEEIKNGNCWNIRRDVHIESYKALDRKHAACKMSLFVKIVLKHITLIQCVVKKAECNDSSFLFTTQVWTSKQIFTFSFHYI